MDTLPHRRKKITHNLDRFSYKIPIPVCAYLAPLTYSARSNIRTEEWDTLCIDNPKARRI